MRPTSTTSAGIHGVDDGFRFHFGRRLLVERFEDFRDLFVVGRARPGNDLIRIGRDAERRFGHGAAERLDGRGGAGQLQRVDLGRGRQLGRRPLVDLVDQDLDLLVVSGRRDDDQLSFHAHRAKSPLWERRSPGSGSCRRPAEDRFFRAYRRPEWTAVRIASMSIS
jgi:hypothetical protein